MALAPAPGVGRREEEAASVETIIVLKVRGEVFRFAPNNVPLGEQELCLKQSGFPYETFLTEPFGTIKLIGLWWLARRAAGEKTLAWVTAKNEWPPDITEDDIDLEIEEPGANDPEA